MVCLLFLIPRARSGPLRSKTFQEILILAFRANCAAYLKHSFSDFSPFWDSNFLYKSFSEFFLELYQSDYNLDSWFAYLIYLKHQSITHTIYMYMFCFLINGYMYLFEDFVNIWSQPQVSTKNTFWPQTWSVLKK